MRNLFVVAVLFLSCSSTYGQEPIAQKEYSDYDSDMNGKLTLQEVFSVADKDLFFQESLELFQASDKDGNGELTQAEFDSCAKDLRVFATREHVVAKELKPRFAKTDTDEDGQLTLEEVISDTEEALVPKRKQRFMQMDFDDSGSLNLTEFVLYEKRYYGQIPDPILDLHEAEKAIMLEWFRSADQDSSGGLSVAERKKADDSNWLKGYFYFADIDKDLEITEEELELGLLWAFGIETLNGVRLRDKDGTVYNYRTYTCDADHDRNGILTLNEIKKRFPNKKNEPELSAFIKEVDDDGDGKFSLPELVKRHRQDVLFEFRVYDVDLNGTIDAKELDEKSSIWRKPYIPRAFPAYDTNRDGGLSFNEFRKTPFANQGLRWTDIPSDKNGDGVLSLREFHPELTLGFLGQSLMLFRALDLNGDGSLDLDEYDYNFDSNNLEPARYISILDRDDNGVVTVAELQTETEVDEFVLYPQWYPILTSVFENEAAGNRDWAVRLTQQLLAVEKRVHQNIKPKFNKFDTNSDQQVTLAELNAIQGDEAKTVGQRFIIADVDRNDSLNFVEFVTFDKAHLYVPDPLSDKAISICESIHAAGTPLPRTIIQTAVVDSGILPLYPLEGASSSEPGDLFRAVLMGFGVIDIDGNLIRKTNGHILDLWAISGKDKNRDGRLSRAEYVVDAGEHGEKTFTDVDTDQNGSWTIAELTTSKRTWLFWKDTVEGFQHFDQDLNGLVSRKELVARAKPWQKFLCENTFPAFDEDLDGQLTLHEYRLSLIPNPYTKLSDQPRDFNKNGYIDSNEIFPSFPRMPSLYASIAFHRIDQDRNQRLSMDEIQFRYRFQDLDKEQAFLILDENRNRSLSSEEAVKFFKARNGGEKRLIVSSERVMRIENAFYEDDKDSNGELTIEEFGDNGNLIAAIERGGLSDSRSKRRFADPNDPAEEEEPWDWKMYILIAINILVLAGVGYWVLKK